MWLATGVTDMRRGNPLLNDRGRLRLWTASRSRRTARPNGVKLTSKPTIFLRQPDQDQRTMKNPYSAEQSNWLDGLRHDYRSVIKGMCMATLRLDDESPTDTCEGPIGNRHAIAKRHLQLIADSENRIRANRETGTFAVWPEQYDDLQHVPISQFGAGRWSCQKHDQRFAGIDAQCIDLSEPENLFKAVYRVVLRQNHLTLARWNAHYKGTETEEGWKRFKETAFKMAVSEEDATNAENEWRDVANAVMRKTRDLERRLARREWNSLEYRALLLESIPTVAGWGCLMMKFDLSGLHANDPKRHWNHRIELGYMIVIPQQDGHAIITACEPDSQFRVSEIVRIHKYMPLRANPNELFKAEVNLKRGLSQRIWELNEIGMGESLYQSWSAVEQKDVQAWMKNRGSHHPTPSILASSYLPSILT